MTNERLAPLKQFARRIWNPSIAYPKESIDPLLATRVSFSDFLRPSTNQSLFEQQKAVSGVLPRINRELIQQIPGLETLEQEAIASGEVINTYIQNLGWVIISNDKDVLTTSLSYAESTGAEDFSSPRYTIRRNTKTKKTQIEIESRLENGAEFSFKRTFGGGYEIDYSYEDRHKGGVHQMKLFYNRPNGPNGPDVILVKRRPVINDEINNVNEIYYQVNPSPSAAIGILLINEQTVNTSTPIPYDFSPIFLKSLDLLQEVTSKLHIKPPNLVD